MKTRSSQLEAQWSVRNAGEVLALNSQFGMKDPQAPPLSFLGEHFQSTHPRLKIVMLGPSLTSSLGNGAAAMYRGLVRELTGRGHDVLYLERASNHRSPRRDWPKLSFGRVERYGSLAELKTRYADAVRAAEFVIVGSHMREGIEIGEWVTGSAQGATAFYDLDSRGTLTNLKRGRPTYISAALIPRYRMYLSFTGGPLLHHFQAQYGASMARPLYPSVDARLFFPEQSDIKWDLGYLGPYNAERQPPLERLFLETARRRREGRFIVAGSQYPRSVRWPKNVKRIPLVPGAARRAFYNSLRFTLSITPPGAITIGYGPSPRLFEAAACGTPVITEFWPGLDTFFAPDEEILISHSADETMIYFDEISEPDRRRLGDRARDRVLAKHTTRHRAAELEKYALEVLKISAA